METTVRMTGKIKSWNPVSGWGFIHTADNRTIFVHQSSLADRRPLRKHYQVAFDLAPVNDPTKHDRAINVEIIAVPK